MGLLVARKQCPVLCFSWAWPCSPNSPQWLPWPHHGPVNVNCCWQQHCGLRIKEGPLIGQSKGTTPLPRSLVVLYKYFTFNILLNWAHPGDPSPSCSISVSLTAPPPFYFSHGPYHHLKFSVSLLGQPYISNLTQLNVNLEKAGTLPAASRLHPWQGLCFAGCCPQ